MNGSFSIQSCVPDYYLIREDSADYARHVVERMKQQGAIQVFEEIYKAGTPIVVETHLEEWRDFDGMGMKYALHYRLTAVRTQNVVWAEMPPFTFTNHEGKTEWKCPACSIINPIEATYCGEKHEHAVGCGKPREKTRQEML